MGDNIKKVATKDIKQKKLEKKLKKTESKITKRKAKG